MLFSQSKVLRYRARNALRGCLRASGYKILLVGPIERYQTHCIKIRFLLWQRRASGTENLTR